MIRNGCQFTTRWYRDNGCGFGGWVTGSVSDVVEVARSEHLGANQRLESAPITEGRPSSRLPALRSLGGAIGVSALGALLGHQVTSLVASGLARLGVAPSADGASGGIPDVGALPAPVRAVVEDAYGVAVSHVFLVAAPFALLALGAIIAMTEVPLRRTLDLDPADNEPVGANR